MPLLNATAPSTDHSSKSVPASFDRSCLRQPSRGLLGQTYTEVRLWCHKTRQWQTLGVRSQQRWDAILAPIASPHLKAIPLG